MKKSILLCTTLGFLSMVSCQKKESTITDGGHHQGIHSDTLQGNIDGVLLKGKTYYVANDIIIEEGKSLTIEEGVTLLMLESAQPEIIVKGNFYAEGTQDAPIVFTSENTSEVFGAQWGGILAGPTSQEVLLDYVIMEFGGATTTEESTSVKTGFYKAEAGNNVPALWYGGDGKVVVTNSVIRNFNDDGFYLEGGDILLAHNQFYTIGIAGGEAINLKSGIHADVAFNLIYSANTNGLKLSNGGDKPRQAYIKAYNNTIVNAGWRRPTIKGGSVWLEKGVRVDLANNLLVNNRFGIKRDVGSPEDSRSNIGYTYYYGHSAEAVAQFQATDEVINSVTDVIGQSAGANDPQFIHYPLSTDMMNAVMNPTWNFGLQANSPAWVGGTEDIQPHFTSGIMLKGKPYISPMPKVHFGALGN